MLCTYTDNIHENGYDDHQHNSAVQSIKELPTSSYQAKYWSYCLPQHVGQDSNVSHILHILDIQDASRNPVIASVPLYSERDEFYEIFHKNQCTIKEFQ